MSIETVYLLQLRSAVHKYQGGDHGLVAGHRRSVGGALPPAHHHRLPVPVHAGDEGAAGDDPGAGRLVGPVELQPPVPEHLAGPHLVPHEARPQPAAAGHAGQARRVQVDQDVNQDVVKTWSLNKNGYHVLLHDYTILRQRFHVFNRINLFTRNYWDYEKLVLLNTRTTTSLSR